ncbi:MAG: hypothetical protein ACRC9Y_16195 [Aeromonas veronii]
MLRPKPFPNISDRQNVSVMDVHLNNYDTVYVKPLEDKIEAIRPLYFVTKDGKDAPVDKIVVSDPSRASYDGVTKILTLNLNISGVTAFTDLIGVPNRFPNATEVNTGKTDPGAEKTTMFLVAREDGIYYENHITGTEVNPQSSFIRSTYEDKIDALEKRILELEEKLT